MDKVYKSFLPTKLDLFLCKRFLIFQFFPKALTALVQLLSTETSPPTAEHEIKQTYEDWSTAIYGLAEQGGVTLDPLKVDFVCELCSAGMDKLAQEVMKF